MMKGIENDFAALKHEIATLKKDLTDDNRQLSEKRPIRLLTLNQRFHNTFKV